jgi:hypothetical protein
VVRIRLVVMDVNSFVSGQYIASLLRALAFVMLGRKCPNL